MELAIEVSAHIGEGGGSPAGRTGGVLALSAGTLPRSHVRRLYPRAGPHAFRAVLTPSVERQPDSTAGDPAAAGTPGAHGRGSDEGAAIALRAVGAVPPQL